MTMKKKRTWMIKLDQQPGGSRWRVSMWLVGAPAGTQPSADRPIVVNFENDKNDRWNETAEAHAREWAERIATRWEAAHEHWEVAQDSL